MSFVSNIIAAIIRTVAGNNVENELIKELLENSIGVISEKGISEIKDFIGRKKTKVEYILSRDNLKSGIISGTG